MLVPTILNIDFLVKTDLILDIFLPFILTYIFSFHYNQYIPHNVSTIKERILHLIYVYPEITNA